MDFICPYTCSYRTSSGYCGSTGGWERCQYRQLHQPNTVVGYVPLLKKTNADKIRSMTGEELANFVSLCCGWTCAECPVGKECNGDECFSTWLDWLKQEVSDG